MNFNVKTHLSSNGKTCGVVVMTESIVREAETSFVVAAKTS